MIFKIFLLKKMDKKLVFLLEILLVYGKSRLKHWSSRKKLHFAAEKWGK
jgi:hypothetical protein